MRRSLLPGLAAIAHRNVSRGLTDLALFEVGTVFLPEAGRSYGSTSLPLGYELPSDAVLADLRSSIPPQPWHVAALFLGDAVTRQPASSPSPADSRMRSPLFSTSRRHSRSRSTLSRAAITRCTPAAPRSFASATRPWATPENCFLHSLRSSTFRASSRCSNSTSSVLISSAAEDVAATPIVSYPAATQDLSLVVPTEVPAGELLALIREGAGELLEHVRLVDDYRGTGIPETHKSLTFALRFRAVDRTLTQVEATDAKNAAVALAGERVGAELRE